MADKKIIFVTGGTSGIGEETVKELALTGATVVFTARDVEKGGMVRREIIKETNNQNVEYLICDLASFPSIRAEKSDDFRVDCLRILVSISGGIAIESITSLDASIDESNSEICGVRLYLGGINTNLYYQILPNLAKYCLILHNNFYLVTFYLY